MWYLTPWQVIRYTVIRGYNITPTWLGYLKSIWETKRKEAGIEAEDKV
jgi:hypothetical protein